MTAIKRPCSIRGCSHLTDGYSPYCKNHKKRKYRHGHPEQKPVSKRELKPYEKAVREWMDTRAADEAWGILETNWSEMIDTAGRDLIKVYKRGRSHVVYITKAKELLLQINKDARDKRDVILTLLAMGYLYGWEPHRFKDDEAFGFQCVRMIRRYTSASIGNYWDHKQEKVKQVYRDIPPRVVKTLWEILLTWRIPVYGIQIGKRELEERSKRRYEPEEAERAILGKKPAEAMEVSHAN